ESRDESGRNHRLDHGKASWSLIESRKRKIPRTSRDDGCFQPKPPRSTARRHGRYAAREVVVKSPPDVRFRAPQTCDPERAVGRHDVAGHEASSPPSPDSAWSPTARAA